jgi:hypothetical protein
MINFLLRYLQLRKYGKKFQGSDLPKGSVGRDVKRAKEVYDKDAALFREQVNASNQFNLFLRHEPLRRWHRVHSNELMRGKRDAYCNICE